MSAPLDLANRFSSLEEDDANEKGKKQKPLPAHGQASGASKKDNSRSAKKNEAHAAEVATFNKEHPQGPNDRHGPRVQDRFHNRRGRGGSAFRGREYINDNNERQYDRRGAATKHRGGLHKGGALLGKETDPEISQPLSDSVDGEVVSADISGAATADGEGKIDAAEFKPIDPEEEAEAKKKTYEEYLEELRKKAPEDDLKKQVREAQNDEKQWKKVVALKKTEESVKLGKDDSQDVHKEDDTEKKNKNSNQKKEKKILSLDEFVGGAPSAPAGGERGGERGGNRGGYRGRGGKAASSSAAAGLDVNNDQEFPALGK